MKSTVKTSGKEKKHKKKKWRKGEKINYFKGKSGEIRTAPGKQKKRNAHVTTADFIAKNRISVFQTGSTDSVKPNMVP